SASTRSASASRATTARVSAAPSAASSSSVGTPTIRTVIGTWQLNRTPRALSWSGWVAAAQSVGAPTKFTWTAARLVTVGWLMPVALTDRKYRNWPRSTVDRPDSVGTAMSYGLANVR